MENIAKQIEAAIHILCANGHLSSGSLLVIGCSTSEIAGKPIGKSGSMDIGYEVITGALAGCADTKTALAVQCCEHLNRALVVPSSIAMQRQYEKVSAVPHATAGGSCASAAWQTFTDPVLVEFIQAEAGIDIGDTLIGMHLRPVAVPLRCDITQIGYAHVTMAYTRPKYIGGSRAKYTLQGGTENETHCS